MKDVSCYFWRYMNTVWNLQNKMEDFEQNQARLQQQWDETKSMEAEISDEADSDEKDNVEI